LNKISVWIPGNEIKSFVWSVALYGAETWTILKAEKAKIEIFKVWCWRTQKISWTKKIKMLKFSGKRTPKNQYGIL